MAGGKGGIPAAVLVTSGRLPPALRWIDEQHALAVFPDPGAARAALPALQGGPYAVRPFFEASKNV